MIIVNTCRPLICVVVLPTIIISAMVILCGAVLSGDPHRESHRDLKNTPGGASANFNYKDSSRRVSMGQLNGNLSVTPTSVWYSQAPDIGAWSSIIPLPIVPIHMHMLPNGNVFIYQDDNDPRYHIDGSRGPGLTVAYVWDVSAGTFTQIDNTTDNVFCSGHSFLPDGQLLITGGHISDGVGIRSTTIFDYRSNTWSTGSLMNAGRWYPTNTSLGNGEVLVVSGDIDNNQGRNTLPQVWRTTGGWRSLTTALRSLPLYPMMHLAPNGLVFNSGPNQNTSYLNTTGTGSWQSVANRNFGSRSYGSSVLYDDGKVLVVGGGDPPTRTAEVIDLNATSPTWRNVAPMAFARRQLNATLLPDGTVLVTGGTSSGGFNNATNGVLAAEVWNPLTETWTTMASMQRKRLYHSTAILLPDGRVLTAGGGRPKPTSDTDQFNAEIYSPPYLFRGARPVITSVPDSVNYGQTFFVATPDAPTIAKVTWVRLSSATHAFNMEQRINHLSFSPVADGLNIVVPSNINLCPPGYYMLFILNSSGVPSVAKFVRVDAGTIALPAAPTSLTATTASISQINLAWTDNSNNEEGFRIEQCQGEGCTNFVEIATVAANTISYSNTGLSASTTYQYRVRAHNSGGNSDYSDIASATTSAATPPAAPSNLMATAASSSQINLAWTDNSNNEEGFRIEQCQGEGCTNFVEIATVAANTISYSNTGLSASTTYQYRVRAHNSGGNSDYSNVASATTPAARPAAPSDLTATKISSSQINLNWTDNSNNESGFQIERCANPNCTSFAQITTVGANVTAYTDTGLQSNRTYRYRVRAFNSGGNSEYSNIANPTAPTSPAAPSSLTATAASSSQINLSWTDNSSNEEGFRIEQCQGEGCTNFVEIATVGPNIVSYSNTGLSALTTYQYRVRAYNSGGNSDYSDIASATTSAATPPAAPSNLMATAASSSQINLSWADNSNNEEGFRIEQCQGEGCTNFVEIVTVAANTISYSNTGLSALTTYQYRVRAYNSGGNSAYSNESTATTTAAPPAAPSDLTATKISSSQITLNWTDNSNNESGFQIERCTNPNCTNFAQIATVGANITAYTDTGLQSNRTYRYRVRAFNADGNSPYSNIASSK